MASDGNTDCDDEPEELDDVQVQETPEVPQPVPTTSGVNQRAVIDPGAGKLSGVNSKEEAMNFLASNPHLGNIFKRMIREGIQENKIQGKSTNQITLQKGRVTEQTADRRVRKMEGMNANEPLSKGIKSPSDMTLYVPAFNKIPSNVNSNSNEIIQRISNFVEEIKIGSNPSTPKDDRMQKVQRS